LKKCPRCDSISSDSENLCGVCGGSLSEVTSEPLEQLVHKTLEVRPKRKLNVGALALIILALSMAGGGIALLAVQNGFGLVLLLGGLVLSLLISGGVGVGIGRGKWRMQRDEGRQIEEELKKKRGEED
jgi:hypothetical protein